MLPGGTLTFLFTDVEGSTRLLHELGDATYGRLLEIHRGLIRDSVTAHGGIEFGTGGDALFVVFDSPSSAIAAAGAAQHALGAYAWPDPAPLRVRMAVHTGEATVVDGDYVGRPLHVVARLCAAGHGGQVLVSDATRALVRSGEVRSLGSHRLRDVPDAIEVFQLGGAEFPPLRTLSALPNNLPAPSDRLIGRELEVVEVAEALVERRLVTLIGPGGAGKTRVALEVGASVLPEFADGVWFIALGVATTADQVEALTSQALRIGERGIEPLGFTLRSHLSGRELLLVVDNCEHLVDAVAEFTVGVLEQCPKVRVLATSRELLGVRGEHAIAVSPLGDDDATQLFIERARAVVPGFDEATENPAAIAEICRRLDGLPLAIELAAARLRGISLRQIGERLDDRFRLLGSGRGRTLETVVSWSYGLLDDNEQAVFRRLALFADSFDLAGAEAVAGWDDVDPSDVLEIVIRLIDKSLIVPSRTGDDYRYHMLETLRQYGRDQLTANAEGIACVQALFAWARAWTDRLQTDMRTARQDTSLAAATVERENLRAVFEQARAAGHNELALRIATFVPTMSMRERRDALDELLDTIPGLDDTVRGHALTSYAQFSFGIGEWRAAMDAGERAAELFERIGDLRLAAWGRYFVGFAAWGHIPDDELRELLEPVLGAFRDLDERLGLAYMLWVHSQLEADLDLADAQAAEAEAEFRTIGAPFGLAHCLEGRARICMLRDEPSLAVPHLSEALGLLVDAREAGCVAHAVEAVASLLTELDNRADAAVLLGAAEELRVTSGHAHRPWELRNRDHAEKMLRSDDLETERALGRALDIDTVVTYATQLLEHARAVITGRS